MPKVYLIGSAAALLFVSGLLHGLRTGRWQISHEPLASAAKLEDVPMTIGDWDGETIEVDSEEFARAGAVGYLVRRYRNRFSGEFLTLAITCGRPGPIAVHTPDVCYGGAGFAAGTPDVPHSIEYQMVRATSQSASFRVGQFQKDVSGITTRLRVFWTWSATGSWGAPNNPRLTFARYPALYKLYLIRQMAAADDSLEEDPAREFISLLLGQLNQVLFDGR